jgi:hypothetical protein
MATGFLSQKTLEVAQFNCLLSLERTQFSIKKKKKFFFFSKTNKEKTWDSIAELHPSVFHSKKKQNKKNKWKKQEINFPMEPQEKQIDGGP